MYPQPIITNAQIVHNINSYHVVTHMVVQFRSKSLLTGTALRCLCLQSLIRSKQTNMPFRVSACSIEQYRAVSVHSFVFLFFALAHRRLRSLASLIHYYYVFKFNISTNSNLNYVHWDIYIRKINMFVCFFGLGSWSSGYEASIC